MRKYALVFTALFVSSYLFPGSLPSPTPSGAGIGNESSSGPSDHHEPKPPKGTSRRAPGRQKPEPLTQAGPPSYGLQDTMESFCSATPKDGECNFDVTFATVPDPVGSHLADLFDQDVAAIQDGVEDTGVYVFDRAYFPWELPHSYNTADDSEKAAAVSLERSEVPGVLLFRNRLSQSPYRNGEMVFVITESPTSGINLAQIQNAMQLLSAEGQKISSQIKILGPTFSGSYDSLVLAAQAICGAATPPPGSPPPQGGHRARRRGATPPPGPSPPPCTFKIRSGSTNSEQHARLALARLTRELNTSVDLGSVNHPFDDSFNAAYNHLLDSGVTPSQMVLLSEDESAYGTLGTITPANIDTHVWKVRFPRDISSVRTNYEEQALLERDGQSQGAKKFLTLPSNETDAGDSLKIYGEARTTETQEAILFGIAEFLKAHDTKAVLIAASNENDQHFLAQFLHSQGQVRLVMLGSSRLFMRGNSAPFRGDLAVSAFPLLARLPDWTRSGPSDSGKMGPERGVRVFGGDRSQGLYAATVDLLRKSPGPIFEYDAPSWVPGWPATVQAAPPIYVTALGNGQPWPVSMEFGNAPLKGGPATAKGAGPSQSLFQMPFEAAHADSGKPYTLYVAHEWRYLFLVCVLVWVAYLVGFLVADPVNLSLASYLFPYKHWRYCLLVFPPAVLSSLCFSTLYRAVRFPAGVPLGSSEWALWALNLAWLFPLLVLLAPFWKAWRSGLWLETGPVERLFLALAALATLVGVAASLLFVANGPAICQREAASVAFGLYREMHWLSGLSLLPTVLLLLLALWVWCIEAGRGASLLSIPQILPACPSDPRISGSRTAQILSAGQPMVNVSQNRFFCILVACIVAFEWAIRSTWHGVYEVTSLDSWQTTAWVLNLAGIVISFIAAEVVQFWALWSGLRDLFSALEHHRFTRSFVPIRNFDWHGIWSFGNGALHERRRTIAAQIDVLYEIKSLGGLPAAVEPEWQRLRTIRQQYKQLELPDSRQYLKDLVETYSSLGLIAQGLLQDVLVDEFDATEELKRWEGRQVGHVVASITDGGSRPLALRVVVPQFGHVVASATDGRFAKEMKELEALTPLEGYKEKFICLLYIGFFQVVVARLRSLLMSMVSMFTLAFLAMAIYPFQPSGSLFWIGAALLVAIAGVMLAAFGQMDTNPVLAKIVDGDPNKLEWNFYSKIGEWLALPLLTLVSSVLPGGTGRLISFLGTIFTRQ